VIGDVDLFDLAVEAAQVRGGDPRRLLLSGVDEASRRQCCGFGEEAAAVDAAVLWHGESHALERDSEQRFEDVLLRWCWARRVGGLPPCDGSLGHRTSDAEALCSGRVLRDQLALCPASVAAQLDERFVPLTGRHTAKVPVHQCPGQVNVRSDVRVRVLSSGSAARFGSCVDTFCATGERSVSSRFGLDVEVWIDGGRVVVEVGGELDRYNAPALREDLARVDAPRPFRLAVVMERLEFIDSAGIGVLVAQAKRARATGGRVALVGCVPLVDKILRRMGLDKVFGLYAGLDDALTWLDAR
jgi:anti-sigma B factor antagonist